MMGRIERHPNQKSLFDQARSSAPKISPENLIPGRQTSFNFLTSNPTNTETQKPNLNQINKTTWYLKTSTPQGYSGIDQSLPKGDRD